MLGSCRLNNKSMRNIRRTEAYQAMAIDLALLGVISKEECEMLLDGGIPSGIALPDGSSKLTSEKNLPPKPGFIQAEPDDDGLIVDTVSEDEPIVDTVSEDEPIVDTVSEDEPIVDTVSEDEPIVDTVSEDEPIVDTVSEDEAQEPVDDEGRTESDN